MARVQDLEEKVKDLEREARLFSKDISAADDEIEQLHSQITILKRNCGGSNSAQSNTGKKTDDVLAGKNSRISQSKEEVISQIKEILMQAKHNVMLTTPGILDLIQLELFEVRSSVNVKVSCEVDKSDPEQLELLDELSIFTNITIKQFNDKDRFSIMADGGIFLFAGVSSEIGTYLSIQSSDEKHVTLFNPLITHSWISAQKI